MARIATTEWIWCDGEFIRWDQATLHVTAHVVHYGSAVFEGIRCYDTPRGTNIFRLDDHLRRLYDSARVYRMRLPYDLATLRAACGELVTRNGLAEGYVRPIVLRGVGGMGVDPRDSPIHTYLLCWPWGSYLGTEALDAGVDVRISGWFRPAPNTHPTLVKCAGNYVNAQLMKMEAQADGYAEAIALAYDGTVSEASAQNVFLVKDGVLTTPPLDGSMLAGITRDCVITLAEERGVALREQRIPREALYTADELFLTGTASEITPVRSVDRIEVGTGRAGPITRRLQRRLLEIARGAGPDPFGWSTLVGQELRLPVAERTA